MRVKELIVDSFAGGGGASLGIQMALGRGPDVAINHDAAAIVMHAANHLDTTHYTEDVWKLNPRHVTGGRAVGLLWASPDCKHFSRAKGGKPVEKRIRSLAWVVIKWAAECQPRVIILENVREFEEWGPLVPRWYCRRCEWRGTEGQASYRTTRGRLRHACPRCGHLNLRESFELVPDPDRKGLTFRRFAGRLRGLGYQVDWRNLDAADFGAPTHRRRLFLIARRDGKPIAWPEPTHANPARIGQPSLFHAARRPWRTAAECIDWSIPCPSIFGRKKPLAEATLRRIAQGIKRYVLENPRPFLVACNHGGDEFRGQECDHPLPTVTGSHSLALCTPYVCGVGGRAGQSPATGGNAPLGTITAKNDRAVVAPVLARIGQTGGNGLYSQQVESPLSTVVSKNEHLLVCPYLIQRYGERDGQEPRCSSLETPCLTITPRGNCGSHEAAFLAKHYGGVIGCRADEPLPTTTARGTQNQLVAANQIHLNHGQKQWSGCEDPLRTITCGGNHAALVYSFLVKYFGTAIGCPLDGPLPTATRRDRFGLVTVSIEGEPYVIVDIGMRMLKPRELAHGQGFPDTYVLTGSNTSQVEKIGNSVCPVMAKVLVESNYP